jgi:hypothetical protein
MTTFLPHVAEEAIFRLLEDLATPRSLSVFILMKNSEWDQLSMLELDPRHYLNEHSYWRDATATNILRKCEDMPTSFNRKVVAEEAFLSCELECLRTNRRLYSLTERTFSDSYPEGVHDFFNRARKIVSEILGPCPDLVEGKFGPGATFGDRGQLCTIPDKMSSEPTFTPDSWPFLFPWSGTLWASACSVSGKLPKRTFGNRFTTVPKDSTKFRGIAVEPSINVFFQLGYGKVIRRRLSRRGINLDEGQDIHRQLACAASIEGHLCTLDLKNASDTICKNLVKLLLPPRWFEVLSSLRSPKTFFRGSFRLLEKFSSMGNGFTFELETLIFLSLVAAIVGGDSIGKTVFAFGDDLIMPTESSQDVISMLKFCGLTVNVRKSFVDGDFRESCGGDFFKGSAVRPYFLKESPTEPQELIGFANGLVRSCNGDFVRRFIVNRAWLTILNGLPVHIRRLRGPQDLGDLVIHDYDQSRWQTHRRHGIRYVKVYRPARFRKVSWHHFTPSVTLASAVYGLASGAPFGTGSRWSSAGIIPRNSVQGYKIGWVAYS